MTEKTGPKLRYTERFRLASTGSLGDIIDDRVPDEVAHAVWFLVGQSCTKNAARLREFHHRLHERQVEETGIYLKPDSFIAHVCSSPEVGPFLDFIERAVEVSRTTRREHDGNGYAMHPMLAPELEERLNHVFTRHSFGFRVTQGHAMPVLSPVLSEEVLRPALLRVRAPGWEQVEQRYVEALRLLRGGDAEGSIHEAGAALEAALKASGLKGKTFGELTADYKQLPTLPGYAKAFPDDLVRLLNVANAARNVDSRAHGQAPGKASVEPAVARLVVNLAGTFIVFLQETIAGGM